MSKRSLFWSTASGKLGDLVLRTVRGETIASKYQPVVANPRSYSQMYVRAQFATAVKFYRHATDNVFKFAFEDKKRNESDYNAFMRYNAKRGVILPKDRSENYAYPAYGKSWQLSNGSLPEIQVIPKADSIEVALPTTGDIAIENIGDLSKLFIDNYGLQDGDFVTIVLIQTPFGAYDMWDGDPQPKWYIYQFMIDSKSEEDDNTLGLTISENDTDKTLVFTFPETLWKQNGAAAAIIASRPTSNTTFVSPSYTVGNTIWDNNVANYEGDGAIKMNLSSWGATPDAILKGSVSVNK